MTQTKVTRLDHLRSKTRGIPFTWLFKLFRRPWNAHALECFRCNSWRLEIRMCITSPAGRVTYNYIGNLWYEHGINRLARSLMEPSAFVDFIYVKNRVKNWFSARDANLFLNLAEGRLLETGRVFSFSNKKRDCSLRELYPHMDISVQTLKRRPVSVWCGK